jgi:hypothetical protein
MIPSPLTKLSIPSSIPSDLESPSPDIGPTRFKELITVSASKFTSGARSSKRVCMGLGDDASRTAPQNQASTSTAGPAPKEIFTDEYKVVIDGWIQKVEQHSETLQEQTKTIKEQGAQVQQTMQMLGDIFDTHAAQNTAIERMRTDTTYWIRDLEKENKKQKTTIDRLRLELRQQKDSHKEFVMSTEARFERMAQDNKVQLALVMDSIRNGDKGKIPKELEVPGSAVRVSPRKRARQM